MAMLASSLVTILLYHSDKKKADSGEWRTAEATLHLWEILGGWPGAFLAQRRYRHKIRKFSYQFVFWLIVALYQLAAVAWLARAKVVAWLDSIGAG